LDPNIPPLEAWNKNAAIVLIAELDRLFLLFSDIRHTTYYRTPIFTYSTQVSDSFSPWCSDGTIQLR